MMEITVSYDDLTRTLGKPVSDYGGTTLDANSTKITVTGIPDGYSARLDFDVSIRVEGSKKKVSPYLPLDADGSCIVPGTIMRACKADLRLPVQLVLESSDKTETYASRNWLIFRVSPSINAFETVQDAYEPDISKAFYKVEEEGGVIVFTRLDGMTETVNVDDDFVAWKDVVSDWPEEPDDHTIPTIKLLDDTFLKSNLTAPNRLLITDGRPQDRHGVEPGAERRQPAHGEAGEDRPRHPRPGFADRPHRQGNPGVGAGHHIPRGIHGGQGPRVLHLAERRERGTRPLG